MCATQKKVADQKNLVIKFSPDVSGAGELHGGGGLVPTLSPYTQGDGTYEVEYLMCKCTFKVVVVEGHVYEHEQ